jgi:hypothetical protein
MSVIHPAPKFRRMNSLEKFYIQFFRYNIIIINEQSEEDKIPSLISITTYKATRMLMTHIHSLPFECRLQYSLALLGTERTTVLTYSLQYTILFINILITSYSRISCISGCHHDAHNTRKSTQFYLYFIYKHSLNHIFLT